MALTLVMRAFGSNWLQNSCYGSGPIKPLVQISHPSPICTEIILWGIPEEYSRTSSASDSANNETAWCNTSQQRQHAVRDTSCICRQCYNDGVAYFPSCSGWVKHTLTKAVLNRPTEPESWRLVEMLLSISSATLFTTELTESKTKENTLRTRNDSANQSPTNARRCNAAHGIDFCVQRAPLSSL